MANASAKFNVYDYVTQAILKELEAGTVPWRKPWTGDALGLLMPERSTGEAYRGINVLMLWVAAETKGYLSPRWLTYRQASELGGQVRKGEKSSTVVKYGTYAPKEDAAGAAQSEDNDTKRGYARAYRVFNADQIDGLSEDYYRRPEAPRDLGTRSDPALEGWFGRMGVPILLSEQPRAFYRPSDDTVHMPAIESFESTSKFYGTLAHEIAHATLSKTRLNRVHKGSSEERYAKEEVVAELAAAMVGARLGIEPEFDQNAAYLKSWISVMKQDNRAIVRVASMAQAAADWMFETAGPAPEHGIARAA